jgi:LacI family transcriptional regulator
MAVSINDIAKALNISKSTVSRALRDHPDLKKSTKQLVMAKAQELGYEPNSIAKALSTRQTFVIGVILPHIRHTFFAEALNGIEDYLREKGFSLLIASSNEDDEQELQNIKNLISKRVDGMLISISSRTDDRKRFELIEKQKIPFVFFDRIIDQTSVPAVTVDHNEINRLILSHLKELGANDIVHLSGHLQGIVGKRRLEAFKKAAMAVGLDISDNKIINGNLSENAGIRGLKSIQSHGSLPDAISTSASMQALGIMQEARQNQIHIPDDLLLTGYHVTPVTELVYPRITGVQFSIYDMGYKAAQLLLEQITNSSAVEPETIHIPVKLLIRESSQTKKNESNKEPYAEHVRTGM